MKQKMIKCEIYTRVVGFFSPVHTWNPGKKEEFKERVPFDIRNFTTNRIMYSIEEDNNELSKSPSIYFTAANK